MTHERDIERLLDRWLDDGPSIAPDRVIDGVADRIGRQPQRPAWRLLRRDIHVNPIVKLTAVAAAVIVVAAVGIGVLGRPPANVGGSDPTPPPTASLSATSAVSRSPGRTPCPTTEPACTGALDPGTHSTDALITPVTYTVPAGWSKPLDVPGALNLVQIDETMFIAIWPDWNPSSGDSCVQAPSAMAGHGRTLDDLVAWLTEHEGLVVSAAAPVTIDGIAGQVLDARMATGYTGPCGAKASIFTHQGTINDGGALELTEPNRTRLYFFDVGAGHVVNIAIVAEDAADFDSFVTAATPIVESVTFE